MADKNFELLIRIQAELSQAKTAADELQRQITLAKEAGRSYDGLAQSLKVVEQRMGELEAAAQKTAQAVDLKRYNEAPAQSTVANPRADSGSEDDAMKSRMASYREGLALRKELSAAAAREVADYTSLSPATREYIKELNETNVATNRLTITKKSLKDALKGLSSEFPLLGNIGKLAMNPIIGSAAAIAAGFAVWRYRLQQLNETYSATELPDISPPDIVRVNQAADAWRNLAKAVSDATAKYDSAHEASERVLKKMEQTLQLKKKELEADKELELVKLDQQKEQMEPEDYAAKKAEIETRYGKAGLAMDKKNEQDILARKSERSMALGLEARDAMEAASKIHISPQDRETKYENDLKAQADAADKEIKERQARKDWLSDLSESGRFMRTVKAPKFLARYGYEVGNLPEGEAIATAQEIEQTRIDSAKGVKERYANFLNQKAERERQRQRKAELEKKAQDALAEKAVLDKGIKEDSDGAKERTEAAERIAQKKIEADRIRAETEAARDRKQRDEKSKRDANAAGNKADQEVEREGAKFRTSDSGADVNGGGNLGSNFTGLNASLDKLKEAFLAGQQSAIDYCDKEISKMATGLADANSRITDSFNG